MQEVACKFFMFSESIFAKRSRLIRRVGPMRRLGAFYWARSLKSLRYMVSPTAQDEKKSSRIS